MLGRHETAKGHAVKALHLLRTDNVGMASSAIAVCLHNIAVEQIYLAPNRPFEALESVTDAIELASRLLDQSHPWLGHFRHTYNVALKMSAPASAKPRALQTNAQANNGCRASDRMRTSHISSASRDRNAKEQNGANQTRSPKPRRQVCTPDVGQLPRLGCPVPALARDTGSTSLERMPSKLQSLKVSTLDSMSPTHTDSQPKGRATILGLPKAISSGELDDELQHRVSRRSQMIRLTTPSSKNFLLQKTRSF